MTWEQRYSWWLDGARRRVGLITRAEATKRGVPHLTERDFPGALDELDRFAAWLEWFEARVGPRPKTVWVRVPGYAWHVEAEWHAAHPKPPMPPPAPPPPAPIPLPPASWWLPGPLFMSGGSDPDLANGKAGVGTIGRIIEPGVCPLWECRPVSGQGRGLLGQVEGQSQLDVAISLIQKHRQDGDHVAVVGTGGVKADALLAIGVNVLFIELNAQAGWEPYGNTARLQFQGAQDGFPHVKVSYGCYDSVGLADYRDYVPMVWSTATSGFVRGTSPQGLVAKADGAVFSIEGANDTNSWPAAAAWQ